MRYAPILLVLMALTGCATAPQKTVPESLLAECPRPSVDVRTHAGMAQGLLDYNAALRACNDDKAAIRSHLN